jgi:hypothetical protein
MCVVFSLHLQIVAKRGVDYLLCHGPKVHKELWGMTPRDAVLHFIKEACRLEDVPITFYRLQKVSQRSHNRVKQSFKCLKTPKTKQRQELSGQEHFPKRKIPRDEPDSGGRYILFLLYWIILVYSPHFFRVKQGQTDV